MYLTLIAHTQQPPMAKFHDTLKTASPIESTRQYFRVTICSSRAVTVDGRITPYTSASEPRVRSFHARVSPAICPLSSAPFRLHIPPVGHVICGLTPSPHGVSLPHATAWVERFCSVT